ncbi:hypothetical protein M885DRAFT_544392 [Pelagophyceae sp. CCMP2097]|nr:hypothetical protein M885DRAFT_544392 [Pelagophyceae sp. CCMP2097]
MATACRSSLDFLGAACMLKLAEGAQRDDAANVSSSCDDAGDDDGDDSLDSARVGRNRVRPEQPRAQAADARAQAPAAKGRSVSFSQQPDDGGGERKRRRDHSTAQPDAAARSAEALWRAGVARRTRDALFVAEVSTRDGGEVVVFVNEDLSKRFMHSRTGDVVIDPFGADFSLDWFGGCALSRSTRLALPRGVARAVADGVLRDLHAHLGKLGLGRYATEIGWVAAVMGFADGRVRAALGRGRQRQDVRALGCADGRAREHGRAGA